jgi:hypothetical protein
MDYPHSTENISERLAELERMHRHVLRVNLAWRGAGLIALIGCTILVLAQVREGNKSKYLDGQNLIIRDDGGRERIALGASDSNGDISFFDGKGRRRMMIALMRDDATPDGEIPGIILLNEKGEKSLLLRVEPTGANISIRNPTGGELIRLPLPGENLEPRYPSNKAKSEKNR